MLPSMPKVEIVTVNIDGIQIGEYPSSVANIIQRPCTNFIIKFFIDVNIMVIL